jgi:DNA repair protein RadC
MKYYLHDLNHEQFWVMLLSRSNSILYFTKISQGGLIATLVEPS